MTPARQLHLFRSRKQRGSAAPAPSEFASQAFLVDVIRRWIDPRWRFTHMPAGEYRDPIAASRCRRLGTEPGWPDLQFARPDRQMVFLELKRRGTAGCRQRKLRCARTSRAAAFLFGCP